ncbi:MAG: hypothetical protein ACYTG6_13830 [Planctomycetota bacterium]|jgi:hypothetical protein
MTAACRLPSKLPTEVTLMERRLRLAVLFLVATLFAACRSGPVVPAPGPTTGVTLSDWVPGASIDALEEDVYVVDIGLFLVGRDGPEQVTAPRMALFPWQRSNVSILNQTSYIQTYGVEVADWAYVADPVVAILQDGIVVEFLVAPGEDPGREALVAFHATAAARDEPMRQARVHFEAGGEGGTIQLPGADHADLAGVRACLLDEPFELGRLPTGPDGRAVAIQMRVRAVGDVTKPPPEDVRPPSFDAPGMGIAGIPDAPPGILLTGEDEAPEPLDLRTILDAAVATHGSLHVELRRVPDRLVEQGAPLPWEQGRTVARYRLDSALVPGAAVTDLRQNAYLQDYERIVVPPDAPPAPNAPVVFEPVIGIVQSGFSARVEAEDEGPVLVVTRGERLSMPDFHTRLEGGLTVTIELPELQIVTERVPLDGRPRLVSLGHREDGRRLWRIMALVRYEPQAAPSDVTAPRPDRAP